jgi:hypothetical protein
VAGCCFTHGGPTYRLRSNLPPCHCQSMFATPVLLYRGEQHVRKAVKSHPLAWEDNSWHTPAEVILNGIKRDELQGLITPEQAAALALKAPEAEVVTSPPICTLQHPGITTCITATVTHNDPKQFCLITLKALTRCACSPGWPPLLLPCRTPVASSPLAPRRLHVCHSIVPYQATCSIYLSPSVCFIWVPGHCTPRWNPCLKTAQCCIPGPACQLPVACP